MSDHAVPYVGWYPVIVSRNDRLMSFLRVRPERVDATVHGVARRTLVIARVMRLKVMPLAPNALVAHPANEQFRIRRVLVEYLIAVGSPVVLDVCENGIIIRPEQKFFTPGFMYVYLSR